MNDVLDLSWWSTNQRQHWVQHLQKSRDGFHPSAYQRLARSQHTTKSGEESLAPASAVDGTNDYNIGRCYLTQ